MHIFKTDVWSDISIGSGDFKRSRRAKYIA
jgi:hypothetical protein